MDVTHTHTHTGAGRVLEGFNLRWDDHLCKTSCKVDLISGHFICILIIPLFGLVRNKKQTNHIE